MSRVVSGRFWSRAACLIIVATLAGCGSRDATAPSSPSIVGRWEGSAKFGTVHFEAAFTQTGESVGGTGQVRSLLGSTSFTVSGTVRGQEVELTLLSAEYGATTFAGRFTGANTISGRLGNPDEELTIERDD